MGKNITRKNDVDNDDADEKKFYKKEKNGAMVRSGPVQYLHKQLAQSIATR